MIPIKHSSRKVEVGSWVVGNPGLEVRKEVCAESVGLEIVSSQMVEDLGIDELA